VEGHLSSIISVTAAPAAAFSEVSVAGQAGTQVPLIGGWIQAALGQIWLPITSWTVSIGCIGAINHFIALTAKAV